MEYKKPKAYLLHAAPLNLGEVGGRVCYNSFELSEHEQIRNFLKTKDIGEPIESSKLLDKLVWVHHHESVTEHINLTYFVENVSREVIIEWNRHRLGMPTSQQSTRYTMEPVVNAWCDYRDSLNKHDGLDEYEAWTSFHDAVSNSIVDLNPQMVNAVVDYMHTKLSVYDKEEPLVKGLTGSKKKKQNDRVKRCLPEVWMMMGVWTFNIRSLKHFLELRSGGAAYPFIREISEVLLEATPEHYIKYAKKLKD